MIRLHRRLLVSGLLQLGRQLEDVGKHPGQGLTRVLGLRVRPQRDPRSFQPGGQVEYV